MCARESSDTRQRREEDIARYQAALQRDATNASFHALLAEKLLEGGRRDEGIHHFRTAINLSPQGPQTHHWKSKLKGALESQTGVNKMAFTVCHGCQADMPAGTKVCTRCGTTLQMGFLEFSTRPDTMKETARHTIIWTAALSIPLLIFSSLSLEWKACLVCAAVIVGGYYLLRGIGGGTVG